jgi:hypothetical protein
VATLLVLWRRTGQDHFHRLARFWTKIFAVSFAMGVVSGIPLSYESGTNWVRFSENVIGPLIGYEVLTAFFLEATFLGVLLFGWQRVAPWLHVTAAVSGGGRHGYLGICASAFFVLMAFIALVSVWTPLEFERIATRWFSWPYRSPVPLLTASLAVSCYRGLSGRNPTVAFYSAVGLFVVAFIGLVISTPPYLVPPTITLWQAAAAPESQAFILIGIAGPSRSVYDRPLMEHYLPTVGRPLPDRRPAGLPVTLPQRIGEQIDVWGQLLTTKVGCFPRCLGGVRVPLLEFIQHVLAAIAVSRGTYFPEVRGRHALEVGPRRAEFRAMKDRLPASELRQHIEQLRIGDRGEFHAVLMSSALER